MKKTTLTTLCMALFCVFATKTQAQDGYTYTLIDNGNYSYSIGAVPNASTSNFATSVQSYGFTIIVPDGVTASITSSIGSSASATFFDGTAVGQAAIDGYLITETLGSPVTLPAPSAGTITPMVTIQVDGAPTSGIIEILANDSALATTVTPLKSFMAADMVDDGSATFPNVVDPNASALSGTTSFDFAILSVEDFSLNKISVYPNPIVTSFKIETNNTVIITSSKLFNVNGVLVKSIDTSDLNTSVDVSGLQTGLYFLELSSDKYKKTIKLIKQ
ncbi:T9SS type A sorting domain-containing protein [Oceanihabitans sp. 2_MG-2023]|uniref:T9SS type A sorting domain-containing protein n=1 Tax=Oceanihabitans sp. 2_MG-2023 TaxID=3062661 RepID=UPI0026E145A4|nr:T9SS type A sorting domain-containing protein [Oceanihabitans sp. 2_MG-2023]MDO6595359.1 T9SS type A sorting domain-containing protein [Oceanihabitans sp. 2_MG-2023]